MKNPFSLDNTPGPAKPLDPRAARTMASQIVAKSLVAPAFSWPPWAIGVGVIVATAALVSTLHHEPVQPVAVSSPVVSVAAPLPIPEPTITAMPLATTSAVPAIAVPKEPSPEDLLRTANRLRSDGKWNDARDTYERAARPRGSDVAYAALVASAQLRLEHLGDAKGALDRFQEALRQKPEGPLAEDCRLGIADAHHALGDATNERTALEQYVAKHPGGLAISRAKTRLEEMR